MPSFALETLHGRMLQSSKDEGDLGNTLAILLGVFIMLVGICAFLGWYSRRRG